MRTLEDGTTQKGDNFLLLRFIAASMVIYGHAPAVAGGNAPADLFVWLNWGTYSGSIAVDLFFVISGFLVTGSYLRHPHVGDFLWARAIRILPGYAACLLLSAFVLGALFTALPTRDYLAHPDTLGYVLKNLRLGIDMAWQLPGVFTDNPKSPVVNGSIWTLPAEVRMYIGVAILGVIGAISWRPLFNVVAVGMLVLGVLYPTLTPISNPPEYLRLAGLFIGGALCWVNRDRIPLRGTLLLTLIAMAWAFRATPAYPFLFAAGEIAFVFWFAYDTPWRGFNRFGDYSYGIYLWGYPAQQMVAALAVGLPALGNACFGFVLALVLAIASWHLVEQPALRLKGLPGRLQRRWHERRASAG